MVAAADILPWVIAAVGWTLAGVGIYFNVRFGREARQERRESQKFRRIMSSYLKANTRLGQEVSLGTGQAGEVVELPNGEYSVNFILAAEPGAYRVEGSPATLAPSERQQEEE